MRTLLLILSATILFGIIGSCVGIGFSAFKIDLANLGPDKPSVEANLQLANYYIKNATIVGLCVGLFISCLKLSLMLANKIGKHFDNSDATISHSVEESLIISAIVGIIFTLLLSPLIGFSLIGGLTIILVLVGTASFLMYMNAIDELTARRAEQRMAFCFGFISGFSAIVFIFSKVLPFFNK